MYLAVKLPNAAGPRWAKGAHEGVITTDSTVGKDNQTAALAWLGSALEYTRAQGQGNLVGYLEADMEDVVFEIELAAQKVI